MSHSRRNKSTNIRSWYIGSGNRMSVITGKAKVPFNHLKSIYGEELNLIKNSRSELQIEKPEISPQERTVIKNRIRDSIRINRRNQILNLILTIFLTAIILFGILIYLNIYFNNNS